MSIFKQKRTEQGWNMFNTVVMIVLHIVPILGFWYFSWSGIAIAIALYFATGIGVTIGYHRLLTHAGFETYTWVRCLWGILGGLSGEGPWKRWVATHRCHHQFSDEDGDPHSPIHGFGWSHVFWLSTPMSREDWDTWFKKYIPNHAESKAMNLVHTTYLFQHLLLILALYFTGYCLYNSNTGISWVLWGYFVRQVFVLHSTWLINSATHVWGYRNYETKDNSRNLWWVAMLTHGEGWHNNHHAQPVAAMHGHKWWEFDISYRIIWLMAKCGLVWNVKMPKASKQ